MGTGISDGVVGHNDPTTEKVVEPGDSVNRAIRVNLVAGGGAGGGAAQLQVRDPTDSFWVNVGYAPVNLPVPVDDASLAFNVDESAPPYVYAGEATPGALTSDAAWRIQRAEITSSGAIILWANGGPYFTNVWDNRAALAYS